ncbi:MAG: O-antigen ligase family protein [Lutibacter sp.]|nr:O-antigen ligase family protein [Lutibacter sp.]
MIKRVKQKNIFLIKWLLVVLSLLFIPQSALFIVVIFSILYIAKKLDSLDILLVFFLIYFIQNGLVDLEGMTGFRYVLIILLIVKPIGKSGFNILLLFKDYKIAILFLIYIFFNSLLVSTNVAYSLLELFIFMLLLLFTFKGTYSSNEFSFEEKKENLISMSIVILLLSLLMLPFPEIVYARNGTGFQGVSVHPNAFGVFLAPFCGYFLLTLIRKKSIFNFLLFFVTLIFLILSQSRTSLFSLLLGLFVYFIINSEFRTRFNKILILVSIPLFLIVLLNFNKITTSVYGFMNKSGSESFLESVIISRGSLFEAQFTNIKENFFFGIGFKVPSDKNTINKLSLDDKISYEKGNMLSASIEEIGIIGTGFFLLFLIRFLKKKSHYRNSFQILPIIAVFTALGEATLFSIGGLGIFIWTLIFLNRFNYVLSPNNLQ